MNYLSTESGVSKQQISDIHKNKDKIMNLLQDSLIFILWIIIPSLDYLDHSPESPQVQIIKVWLICSYKWLLLQ